MLEPIQVSNKIIERSKKYSINYCDVRFEEKERKSCLFENNEIESIKSERDVGYGIKFLKNNTWHFFSISDPINYDQIESNLDTIFKNSESNQNKNNKKDITSIPITKTEIDYSLKEKPNIDEIIKISKECSHIIHEYKKIKKSIINPWFTDNTKIFINSEGSEIIQKFSDVVFEINVIAHEEGITQSINATEGGRGGLELITDKNKIFETAKRIASKSVELLSAKTIKEENASVVMNPDFVALLTHEILGHPSEGDRVLGKEIAWAGGSWWKGKLNEKIGSESLNVFDDPTLEKTLGWYYFDDEGVQTKRTDIIEKGVLKKHFQSRETSKIFNTDPTGNMRATNFRYVPLIRMACTCIGQGDYKVDEMISEIKDGYLISDMKIPSIDMNRYNWSISCQYANKIENGEITDLLRDVIVMGTAPEFFNSIDACGDDFTIRPIVNCGKGDPMQSMIMGNGGPSIRGKATVKSVD